MQQLPELPKVRDKAVRFIQFLMPDGRPSMQRFMTTTEVYDKAQEILVAGYQFECEMLPDYKTVSFSITGYDPIIDETCDIVTRLCRNGSDVCREVDDMILSFKIP